MVSKSDWKTKPIPNQKEELGYESFFWDADAEKLMAGYKPVDMDDKWFIYSEDSWVYFVRSWSGHHIFAIQLSGSPAGGAKVVSSWVNADEGEYRSPGKEKNIQIINSLIRSRFGIEGNT